MDSITGQIVLVLRESVQHWESRHQGLVGQAQCMSLMGLRRSKPMRRHAPKHWWYVPLYPSWRQNCSVLRRSVLPRKFRFTAKPSIGTNYTGDIQYISSESSRNSLQKSTIVLTAHQQLFWWWTRRQAAISKFQQRFILSPNTET